MKWIGKNSLLFLKIELFFKCHSIMELYYGL